MYEWHTVSLSISVILQCTIKRHLSSAEELVVAFVNVNPADVDFCILDTREHVYAPNIACLLSSIYCRETRIDLEILFEASSPSLPGPALLQSQSALSCFSET